MNGRTKQENNNKNKKKEENECLVYVIHSVFTIIHVFCLCQTICSKISGYTKNRIMISPSVVTQHIRTIFYLLLDGSMEVIKSSSSL